jgi:hypothetical protein
MSCCILLSLAAVGLFLPFAWERMHLHEWHPAPFRDKMQRKIGGEWQYRDMTPEEQLDWFDSAAW